MENVMNEHAPLKRTIIKRSQVAYMNSELDRAINVRNMLRPNQPRTVVIFGKS